MGETDLIANSLGGLSYGGMFIVALLSNLVIPVPEEIVLVATGYLTGIGVFIYPVIMAIFIAGMMVSDYILYSLSFHGSKLVVKMQKRLEKKGFLKNQEYLKKHIKKIIFLSRFLIYLRFIGPVIAGSLKIKRKTFLCYDFLALVIYVNLFMGLGNYFHTQIRVISDGVAKFKNYILTAIVIIVTIVVLRYIQKNFLGWMRKIGEYMPTIIPGLEMKEEEKTTKKKK